MLIYKVVYRERELIHAAVPLIISRFCDWAKHCSETGLLLKDFDLTQFLVAFVKKRSDEYQLLLVILDADAYVSSNYPGNVSIEARLGGPNFASKYFSKLPARERAKKEAMFYLGLAIITIVNLKLKEDGIKTTITVPSWLQNNVNMSTGVCLTNVLHFCKRGDFVPSEHKSKRRAGFDHLPLHYHFFATFAETLVNYSFDEIPIMQDGSVREELYRMTGACGGQIVVAKKHILYDDLRKTHNPQTHWVSIKCKSTKDLEKYIEVVGVVQNELPVLKITKLGDDPRHLSGELVGKLVLKVKPLAGTLLDGTEDFEEVQSILTANRPKHLYIKVRLTQKN